MQSLLRNSAAFAASITVSLLLARFGLMHAERTAPNPSVADAQLKEALYLPNGQGLEFLSFGYKNTLSDLLWFNTISYFGKHRKGDQNYHWLAHMCSLVSDLNPRALHVYDFCSTMLAWEAGRPEEAVSILSKAIVRFPDRWNLYYARGFIEWFFLKDAERSQQDFVKASSFPDAHLIVKRLAAKKLVASNNAQTAVDFLSGVLQTERDPSARAAIEARLREAHYELDFQTLERARDIYRQRHGEFPRELSLLASDGIVNSEFRDPFGGTYRIDPTSGEISSSSNHKRLKIYSDRQSEQPDSKGGAE